MVVVNDLIIVGETKLFEPFEESIPIPMHR